MRNNIVSGHHEAYLVTGFTRVGKDTQFINNLLWDLKRTENIAECLTIPAAAGSGQGVIYADPMLAAPEKGDFRLLPGSPALRASGNHLGAFGPVPTDWQDPQPPTFTIALDAPASRLGRSVDLYWERDSWSGGGGDREYRKTTFENENGNQWLVPDDKINLLITALDNVSDAVQMKVRIGDQLWTEPKPIEWATSIALPADAIDTMVDVSLADEAGNWSKPKTIHAIRVNDEPRFAGDPHVYATRYGMVVAFKTAAPCTARIEWGAGEELDQTAVRTPEVFRDWDAGDGGEWTEVRTGPTRDHVIAVQAPDVDPGATLRYRIILDDGVGHVTSTDPSSITLSGDPRTITLDPAGKDVEGATKPWRSLQFAADRALPGDRIVLRDGLYPGMTTLRRGGIDGAPLTIEAEHKGMAILDAGKVYRRVLQMNETPYVILRGLEMRWFTDGIMNITASPHVTLENMTFWNEHFIAGRLQGNGFFARRSPHLTVRGCLFYRLNEAFALIQSPGFHYEHNTVVSMLHRGCRIIFSTRDSTLINSCFAFTGNSHFTMLANMSDLATFTCDYNNYPAYIRPIAPRRPAPELDLKRPGGRWARMAKAVHILGELKPGGGQVWHHTYSLAEWQALTGKDEHSIYARPQFVDPHSYDWRVNPDSPHIGAGKDGTMIGATSVASYPAKHLPKESHRPESNP